MQHSAQHTLHYNVAAPPCVQVDACGGRGPANLHLQPGGGAHPGSKVAGQAAPQRAGFGMVGVTTPWRVCHASFPYSNSTFVVEF